MITVKVFFIFLGCHFQSIKGFLIIPFFSISKKYNRKELEDETKKLALGKEKDFRLEISEDGIVTYHYIGPPPPSIESRAL